MLFLPRYTWILLCGLCLLAAPRVRAQQPTSAVTLSVDAPTVNESGKPVLPFALRLPVESDYDIVLRTYQRRGNGDSVLLWHLLYNNVPLEAGVSEHRVFLYEANRRIYLHPDILEALTRCESMPAGQYISYFELSSKEDSIQFIQRYLHQTDSTISMGTSLREKVNTLLSLPGGSKTANPQLADSVGRRQVQGAARRLARKLRSTQGLSTRPVVKDGKTYSELYYKDWLMGRYELAATGALNERIASEKAALQGNTTSLVQSELESFSSVGSQVRKLFTRKDDDNIVEGRIEWDNSFSTDVDPNSQQDPNYSEIYGTIGTEVMDIPVGLEGYYTTQDLKRKVKGSYFRFHYDADKAKEELLQLIGSYRQKFSEVSSKGQGLEQIYGSYLNSLKGEEQQLLSSFGKEYGVDGQLLSGSGGSTDALLQQLPSVLDTAGLRQKLMSRYKDSSRADSALTKMQQDYQDKRAKLQANKEKILERYAQLQALQQKAQKYESLVRQYKDGLSLDSALHYAKLEKLAQNKDASYKDMAKAAAGLLPEGKVKRFTTGLTHLEAGILNRYESSYTLAGQTLKGASIGYDLGFMTTSISAGKSEYVSRSGDLDRYNSYSLGLQLKEFHRQKIGLIYYGYSPTQQMLRDGFFKDVNVDVPTFRRPVHIGSLTYQGTIGKNLTLEAEGAMSVKRDEHQTFGMSNAAIKTGAQYLIPKLNTLLKGEWEHMGREFENSSLPLVRAATERYMVGTELELFRSFLSLGVTWNLLKQHNFSSVSTSRRWGFDLRTHSKRYPNVAFSYKPFSTFRAYDDTLSVPQRPLSGEVWTGRGNYQLKRGKNVHRFTLLYNRNTTDGGDSLHYTSATAQAGYSYTSMSNTLAANVGMMELPEIPGSTYSNGRSWFVNVSGGRMLAKKVMVMLGQDVGVAVFGLQRLSTTAGGSYTMEKIPVTLRLTARYTSYRQTEDSSNESLWAGQLGMGWTFKIKKKN